MSAIGFFLTYSLLSFLERRRIIARIFGYYKPNPKIAWDEIRFFLILTYASSLPAFSSPLAILYPKWNKTPSGDTGHLAKSCDCAARLPSSRQYVQSLSVSVRCAGQFSIAHGCIPRFQKHVAIINTCTRCLQVFAENQFRTMCRQFRVHDL